MTIDLMTIDEYQDARHKTQDGRWKIEDGKQQSGNSRIAAILW